MSVKVNVNDGTKYVLNSATNEITPIPKAESGSVVTTVTDKIHEGFSSFMEGFNNFADKVVYTEIEFLLKPIGIFFRDAFYSLIHLLNTNSVEIITLGIIGCSILMIVSPLWGHKGGTWLGRAVAVALVGSVWRLII